MELKHVWVVFDGVQWEGKSVVGVFDSEAGARDRVWSEAIRVSKATEHWEAAGFTYDDHEVCEWMLANQILIEDDYNIDRYLQIIKFVINEHVDRYKFFN